MGTPMPSSLAVKLLLVIGFVLCLAWACVRPEPVPEPPHAKVPRALRPRTPDECPACQAHTSSPLRLAFYRKPGVRPWPERKSRRGRRKLRDTFGQGCPNPACDYFGNIDPTFRCSICP